MSKKALIVTRVSGFVPQFEMNNVRILQEMGYEIHYAANFDVVVYGKDNSRLEDTGIKCHSIPFGRSPFSRDVFRCYRMLKQLMIQQEFDLIHCHMPMTGVIARRAAEKVRKLTKRRIPVLYTAHGFHFYKGAPPAHWFYYFVERYYARYTDCLLLMNEEDFQRGSKFHVRGKTEYIPGIGMQPLPTAVESFDLRKEYNIPQDWKIVVSVGEMTERKNHQRMIKTMDRFRRQPLVYVICGTGPLECELHQMVQEMHLQKKVIFTGYCDTVADVLRQADVFAFPSLQEGLPVAVMEAMQAGLPVVGLNIRGNRDLIENKKGSFLLEEDIEEGYAGALQYLLKHPEEAVHMGQWNRKRMKKFSMEKVDNKMRKIYAELERES